MTLEIIPGILGAQSNLQSLENEVKELEEELHRHLYSSGNIFNACELEQYEQKTKEITLNLQSAASALALQKAALSELMQAKEKERLQITGLAKRYKSDGFRETTFQPAVGPPRSLWVRRYRKKKIQRRGPKSKKRPDKGLCLFFIFTGIFHHTSPVAAHEIAAMAAAANSFEEASLLLKKMGLELSSEKVRQISLKYAQAVRQGFDPEMLKGMDMKGKRAFLSTDGGRVRERQGKRSKGKKGGKRYTGKWREPKLFIFFLLDKEGKRCKDVAPLIDGAIQDADACLSLLMSYFLKSNLREVKELVIVADGAKWIWERVKKLIKKLGLNRLKVFESIDFYHVMEQVHGLGKLVKKKQNERKKWVDKMKEYLLEGMIGKLLEEMDTYWNKGRGKTREKTREYIGYFRNNQHLFNMKGLKEKGLPIGSGAMESAVRMVINMRVKGSGKFWKEENANGIILLRSYWKSGRFDELKGFVLNALHEPLESH